MDPEYYVYGGLAIGGIFLLCALFGSTRPLPGVLAAGLAFLCALSFWLSLGSLDMSMVGAAVNSLILVPLIAFAITLLIGLKHTATPISGKNRWAAALAGIIFCAGGYWAGEYFSADAVDARAEAGIRAAVRNADGRDLHCWLQYRTGCPRSFPLKMILEEHGLSEKTFLLLSSQERIWNDDYQAVLHYPKTPERQELLRKLAATGRSAIGGDVFIALMDAGDFETVDILYHCFVPGLDLAMIDKDRLDLLREVLRRGPTQTGESAGHIPPHALWAAAANAPEYAQVLLDAGQRPDTADLAHACAVTPKNRGTAELLLSAGADPNGRVNGLNPLQTAVAKGTPALVDALLAAGAEVDTTETYGRTALHIAAMFGNMHAAEKLLERGLSPSAADGRGLTPLHWAAWIGDPDMTGLLLQAGAPADTPDGQGWTPLFHAAYQGHAPVLAVLLRDAPKVNSLIDMKNDWNETALDLAADPGTSYPYWYEYLLEARDIGITPEALGVPQGEDDPHPGVWRKSLERRAGTVALLLAAGADATRVNKNSSILHRAFETGHVYCPGVFLGVSKDWSPSQYLIGEYVTLDAPPLYTDALEALFAAGASLPEMQRVRGYCSNNHFGYALDVSGECRALLEKEIARRGEKADE